MVGAIKFIPAVLVLFVNVLCGYSQEGWSAVADPEAVSYAFNASLGRIRTIDCRFVQEKYVDVLESKAVSEGTFSFSAPDRILIVYLSPEQSSVEIDGNTVTSVGNGGRKTVKDMSSDRRYARIKAMIASGPDFYMQGQKKQTMVSVYERGDEYMFEIRPQGIRMKIRIIAEKNDMSVSSFRMEEPDGDYTEFFFTDRKVTFGE